MRKTFLRIHAGALLAILAFAPAYGLLGIGAHKGIDFSIDMGDASSQIVFEKSLMHASDSVIDGSITYTLTRMGWERTLMNFGGKFFVDVIPVIDALEISFNFGTWEYQCNFTYPYQPIGGNIIDSTVSLTPENFGIDPRWGVNNLPYTKLHIDLTIRKYIVRIPKKLKLLNLHAGGGFNFIMETAVITENMVREKFATVLTEDSYNMLDRNDNDKISGKAALKDIIRDIMGGMTEKNGGIHLVAGATFQLPAVPLALYGDAKLLVPFAELGGDAKIGGIGFVLNAGVAISIAESHRSHTEGFE
jgi:hypothetical protein